MKKNYFIIIQLIISSLSFGQIKDLDIPTTTAGPDSYQFNKISSVFNNNSGGGFSYSYPLGQISEGNMTIPISLNYYTNGIKVDELAGYTGTNWNLSYGGVITRTVKGIPDEQAVERWHPHIFDYTSDDFYNKITSIAQQPRSLMYDSERDLFQFNINGKSGYFHLPSEKITKDIIITDIISEETYKIIFNHDSSESEFKLISNDGIEYTFGGDSNYTESNRTSTDCSTPNIKETAITSWYLKSIKNVNGKIIKFEYSENNYDYTTGVNQTISFTEKSRCADDVNKNFLMYNSSYKSCLQYSNITSRILKAIESDTKRIEFKYTENRNDELKYELSTIEFINKFNNKTLKKINLIYDFININKSHIHYRLVSSPNLKRRLFLKEIQEIASDNSNINKTKFEYNNLNNLPIRLSFEQDKYGYYNAAKNSYLFPNTSQLSANHYQIIKSYGYINYFKNNVEPNDNVYNGVLNKIIHSTGGETNIEYEPNFYHDIHTQTDLKYQFADLKVEKPCGVRSEEYPGATKSFDFISNGEPVYLQAFSGYGNECNPGRFDKDPKHDIYHVSIRDITNSDSGPFVFNPPASDYGESILNDPEAQCSEYVHINQVPICTEIGNKYRVTIWIGGTVNSGRASVNIQYNGYYETKAENRVTRGPGIRVKKVYNKEADTKYNQIEYYYNSFDKYNQGITASSANIANKGVNLIEYYTKTDAYFECKCDEKFGVDESNCYFYTLGECFRDKRYIEISSGINQTYFNTLKNDITYSSIVEIHTNETSKYYTQKNYNIESDQDGLLILGTKTSFAPKENLSLIQNGVLKSESFFSPNKSKIKEIEYDYFILRENSKRNYQIFKYFNFPIGMPITSNNRLDNMSIYEYSTYSGITKPKKIRTTEYFSGKQIATETDYSYDSPNHLELTKQSFKNSKNEVITTEYLYPPDLLGDQITETLTSLNRISEPLVIVQKNNDQITSKTFTAYKDFNGIIQKHRTYIGKATDELNETHGKITYDNYDSFGNITQYRLENSIPVTIIWGYKGVYPVAKIEGVALSQISSNIITTLNNSTADTDIEDAIKTLRDTYPQAMVTGYIYSPLIGISKIIQPSGQTESYVYDFANRLKNIIDHQGNVISENQYNYKN